MTVPGPDGDGCRLFTKAYQEAKAPLTPTAAEGTVPGCNDDTPYQ
ncbi:MULTISPECIES: hypothetical protein [unclassified Streptomyces]|nr:MULTISPECIES: hypothetical protein [unclassified Streptomyces]